MRPGIPTLNWLTKNGDKLPKKYQNNPKISKMPLKWPKIVLNILENGPKWARNTDTKLPDLKLWKITKKMRGIWKIGQDGNENGPKCSQWGKHEKCPKMPQNGPDFFPPNI